MLTQFLENTGAEKMLNLQMQIFIV